MIHKTRSFDPQQILTLQKAAADCLNGLDIAMRDIRAQAAEEAKNAIMSPSMTG